MPRRKSLPQFDTGRSKPTGNKIVKRFNYYDADGKRRGKTLTAYSETELATKIVEWNNSMAAKKNGAMTVLDAVTAYIHTKEGVLSPATVRGYESIRRSHIEDDPIGQKKIADLKPQDVQKWINDAYGKGMSPKTLGNHYGLLEPAILMHRKMDLSQITLPQAVKYQGHTPSEDEVKALMEYAKKKENHDLYIAILLAAFGPLRRSEACALTDEDIHGNTITINKAVVKGPQGDWITKVTKTTESAREIDFPDFVIDEIKDIKGPIIKCNPDQLHHRFRRAIKYSGSPFFRYHDLRHFGASILHALNVPDVYIRKRGGWKSDYVMKRVYIDALAEEQRKQNEKINAHFNLFEVKSEVKTAETTL